MPSRDFHRKSRHGCLRCKSRRVKCDFVKPSCGNCYRRAENCRYQGDTVAWELPQRSLPRNSILISDDHIEWPLSSLDHMLLEYYSTNVSGTLFGITESQKIWGPLSYANGLNYPYLKHAILAISACHKSHACRQSRSQWQDFRVASYEHYNKAISLYHPKLGDVHTGNCDDIWATAFLILIFLLSPPDWPNGGLHVEEIIGFFKMTRGSVEILSMQYKALCRGRFGALFALCLGDSQTPIPGIVQSPIQAVKKVMDRIPASPRKEIYLNSVYLLETCFAYFTINPGRQEIVLIWFLTTTTEFLTLLEAEDPVALKIVECYGRCVKLMANTWWVQNLGTLICMGVQRNQRLTAQASITIPHIP